MERGSGGWWRWTAVPPGIVASLPMALTLKPFMGRGGRRKCVYWPMVWQLVACKQGGGDGNVEPLAMPLHRRSVWPFAATEQNALGSVRWPRTAGAIAEPAARCHCVGEPQNGVGVLGAGMVVAESGELGSSRKG